MARSQSCTYALPCLARPAGLGPYPGQVGEGRTYEIRTYGCQMNAHDSERVAGLLEDAGYVKATDGETPDLVVFNTCAVRENAADRLYGNLGHLLPVKKSHEGMQIAVGGCLAQMERTQITRRAPWVDVVYGTHNIGALPALLERARRGAGGVRGNPQHVPVAAAGSPPLAVFRVGVDFRWVQQHLHLLHRAVAARPGEGPPPRRHPCRNRGACQRRRPRGDPAGPERELLWRGIRR